VGDRQRALEDLELTTMVVDPGKWRGRRVLLTGHTGFKGAWTALWLSLLGAEVFGLALPPETDPALFTLLGALPRVDSRFADIRDPAAVAALVAEAAPEIVIHMAAQALVLRSYREPLATFATNVLGTACLLDALRQVPCVQAILVVTSDKVYANIDDRRPHPESDPLGGGDPYSASKAAVEIVVASWSASYFAPRGVPLVTARAGNVIGGGDWSEDRLVPDIWRAARSGADPVLRHPAGTRPWQHVLDCVAGYLTYLQALLQAPLGALPLALNFGPPPGREAPVAAVAEAILSSFGRGGHWNHDSGARPPERRALQLDPGLAERTLGWRARLDLAQTLAWTADWYRAFDRGADMLAVSQAQIAAYQAVCKA
jgi:CDP-glucose 4,6-dehydratase